MGTGTNAQYDKAHEDSEGHWLPDAILKADRFFAISDAGHLAMPDAW